MPALYSDGARQTAQKSAIALGRRPGEHFILAIHDCNGRNGEWENRGCFLSVSIEKTAQGLYDRDPDNEQTEFPTAPGRELDERRLSVWAPR